MSAMRSRDVRPVSDLNRLDLFVLTDGPQVSRLSTMLFR